jgi:polysaccharide deacetylase 2 family uncharacterized protein YibQ
MVASMNWLASFVSIGIFGIFAAPACSQEAETNPFEQFAAEIVEGLGLRTDPEVNLKIAIWPFDLEIPISRDESERLNESFQRALLEVVDPEVVEIFFREGLENILGDLDVFGGPGNLPNPIALFQSSDRINLVIFGSIRRDGERYLLSYEMQSVVSGAAIAQTQSLEVAVRSETEVAQPLMQAVQQIAVELAEKANDLTGIRKSGIRFEDTRQQSPFAINLEEDIVVALMQELTRNGAAILAEREIRLLNFDEEIEPGVYVLTGTYWENGDTVLIRIQLTDDSGKAWTTRRVVDPNTINFSTRPDFAGGVIGALPTFGDESIQRWRAYTQPSELPNGIPVVAIVIGGLGMSEAATTAAIQQLPGPVTLAFVPYAPDLSSWIARARAAGHEVLLQMPTIEPGTSMEDYLNRVQWLLDRFSGFVGFTNYMAQGFTYASDVMEPFLEEVRAQGLLFVSAEYDQKVDTVSSQISIDLRLLELEQTARSEGRAVGFGFPYPVTINRVSEWLTSADQENFFLAPISALATFEPPN